MEGGQGGRRGGRRSPGERVRSGHVGRLERAADAARIGVGRPGNAGASTAYVGTRAGIAVTARRSVVRMRARTAQANIVGADVAVVSARVRIVLVVTTACHVAEVVRAGVVIVA